ncbi:MAG: hypothetical protein ACU0DI_07755 [Paracoccaceae bacterium]
MINRLLVEIFGTGFLLIGIVGSGIMAETLSPHIRQALSRCRLLAH